MIFLTRPSPGRRMWLLRGTTLNGLYSYFIQKELELQYIPKYTGDRSHAVVFLVIFLLARICKPQFPHLLDNENKVI